MHIWQNQKRYGLPEVHATSAICGLDLQSLKAGSPVQTLLSHDMVEHKQSVCLGCTDECRIWKQICISEDGFHATKYKVYDFQMELQKLWPNQCFSGGQPTNGLLIAVSPQIINTHHL